LTESSAESDQATTVQYSPDSVLVETDNAAPGMLVLSDVTNPAWRARVDNAPADTYVADGARRAVAVPPGRHKLEFQYASAALPVGAAITALLVLVCLLMRPEPRC
jgi:uncharacterized membrane protein YfhO